MRTVLLSFWLMLLASCQRHSSPDKRISGITSTSTEWQRAPNIRLRTPAGKRLTLHSLRGKYVVVVFWASENAASREESPNLRKIYRQFQSRGLEIYGVSLDTNRRSWVQAIQADTLRWPQVLEPAGCKGASIQAYGIMSLPYTVLLDPEGRILARNLVGRALGQKISEFIPLD